MYVIGITLWYNLLKNEINKYYIDAKIKGDDSMLDFIKKNNVKMSGEGEQAIIFAAGFGCDQTMWRYVAPQFEKEYRVILFDYVGAGKSDYSAYQSEKYKTLEGYAQDVVEMCKELRLKEVIYVGHSVGATIGMLASLQEPALFKQLIMLGPSPCYINDLPSYKGGFEREDLDGLFEMMELNYIGWANYLSKVVMKNLERPELAAELEGSFCSTDPLCAKEFARATFLSDYRHVLQQVTVSTCILQCKDDSIAPKEVGIYMNEHIKESAIFFMEATGHCPHVSQPEETTQLIFSCLANI